MKLVLLGPPGAGKGTQATGIAEKYNITHISTGDIFRYNIKNETELGKEVKGYLEQGALVPDELTVRIVWDRLDQKDCENGFLLDGFPRTIPQAEALEEGLKKRGTQLDRVINIEVDSDVLLHRLSGRRVCKECGQPYHVQNFPAKVEGVCDVCGGEVIQRPDDNEETVTHRISVYEQQTAPLIAFYRERGLLLTVNGEDPIPQVQETIFTDLDESSDR